MSSISHFEVLQKTSIQPNDDTSCTHWWEVKGKLTFALDVNLEENKKVKGISRSADKDDFVKGVVDILLIYPEDVVGDEVIWFDVVNRGIPLFYFIANETKPAFTSPMPTGKAFFFKRRQIYVACGWQTDLIASPYKLSVQLNDNQANFLDSVEILSEFDASAKFINIPGMKEMDNRFLPIASKGHIPFPACQNKVSEAKLFFRTCGASPSARTEIPKDEWKFGKCGEDGVIEHDLTTIYYPHGFQKGMLYELLYETDKPNIPGIGLAVLRDVAFWLKKGTSRLPSIFQPHLTTSTHRILALGGSQSGRCLRSFIYDDFNTVAVPGYAEKGVRSAIDGLLILVAGASRGQFNCVGGQPGMALPHLATERFPFATSVLQHNGGRTSSLSELSSKGVEDEDSIHKRWQDAGVTTKVIYVNTSIEYHRGDASLLHTKVDGSGDAAINPNCRCYFTPGLPHNPLSTWPPSYADGMPVLDPPVMVQQTYCLGGGSTFMVRAMMNLLSEWVINNKEPPPSSVPSISKNTLVPHEEVYHFYKTHIPSSHPPETPTRLQRRSFRINQEGICTALPPIDEGYYEGSLVPAVSEKDGNELAGVKYPHVQVPVASFTGWALRHPNFGGENSLMMVSGSTLPFCLTKKGRLAMKDCRSSLEERYSSKDDYLQLVKKAALELVNSGFLLADDVQPCCSYCNILWDWVVSVQVN